ncbi:MAG: hypothetical protein Q8K00_01900 [Syntrophales bacterium]|nr:hypothetical protein [Syntrophales bacterium]
MKKYTNVWKMLVLILAIGSSLLLFGCGGGGGSSDGATTGVNGTITGTAVKGPVNGATVTAFAINSGAMGAQIGTGTTDAQGNFTMSIGAYSGPVMLQMTGGIYTNEATGTSMTMSSGDTMTSMMPQAIAGAVMSGVQITPLTSMAQAMAQTMSGGMTPANITAANTAMGNYFSVSDILYTSPMNPLTPGSGTGATQDMRNYGMVLAAMSQYAQTIGMPISSGMVTAMMNDAADGIMNGMMGSTQIMMGGMGGMTGNNPMSANAGTSGLAGAMTAFMGSAMNRSGLTVADMQALMNKMAASNGQIQGGVTPGVNGTITGTAMKGPVNGATVTAFAINSGVMGAQIGTGTTDAQGNFSMSIGAYSGPVMLRMSGGTYTDEATGAAMTRQSGDVMTSIMPQVIAGTVMNGVQMTPLTSMAQMRAQTVSGGMTPANITAANTAMGNYFSVSDILFTRPMNPLTPGSGTGATQEMRNYGMVLAAMSQYAQTIGMPISSGMVTVMMNDAADGVMNGMMGSTQIMMGGMGGMMGNNPMSANAGTSGLAAAMTAFMGSAMNRSGLTVADMQALMNKMNTSSGQIQ